MRVILLVAFWGNCVAIACRLLFLAAMEYPRTTKITWAADLILVVLLLAWVGWIAYALWGAP